MSKRIKLNRNAFPKGSPNGFPTALFGLEMTSREQKLNTILEREVA